MALPKIRLPMDPASATPYLPKAVRTSVTAATIRPAIPSRMGVVVSTGILIAEILSNPLLDGVTLSGGEPFMQAAECALIAAAARAAGLHVMLYSGYTYEEILEQSQYRAGWADLLRQADILIDGRFEKTQRSLELRFRGSRNQRAIDVQASLNAGKPILYEL